MTISLISKQTNSNIDHIKYITIFSIVLLGILLITTLINSFNKTVYYNETYKQVVIVTQSWVNDTASYSTWINIINSK